MVGRCLLVILTVGLTVSLTVGASGQEPEALTDTTFDSFEATGQLALIPERVVGLAVQWSRVRGNVEWPTVSLTGLFMGSLVPLPILEVGGNAKILGNGYVGGGAGLLYFGRDYTRITPTARVGMLGAKGARLEVVWQPLFGQLVMVRMGIARF